MTSLLIAAFLLAGDDPEPDSVPKGPPPRVVAVPAGVGTHYYVETVQVPVMYMEKRVKEEGGKKIEETVAVTRFVMQRRTVALSFRGAKGRTAGGKALDADEVTKRLGKAQIVLVSSDGKPVDKAYLRLYKPDTVVIETPGTPEAMPKDKAFLRGFIGD